MGDKRIDITRLIATDEVDWLGERRMWWLFQEGTLCIYVHVFFFYTDTTNTYIKQQEATDIFIGPDYIQTGKQ